MGFRPVLTGRSLGKEWKMRVFVIGFSGGKGGVETYIDQLTAALPQHDFVYSRPVMEIDGKVWHRPPNRHLYLRYRAFWKNFFRENRLDVLYYNTCDVVSIDMLRFAKEAGIPVRIIHSHCAGNQQAIGRKLSLFHRLSERHSRRVLDRYATHLFACSKAAGDWMFDGRPYTVIKNGIELSRYAFSMEKRESLRRSLHLDGELLVGVIGRLSPQKNPSFAIRVLRALAEMRPEMRAVFLGDGELRQQTEEEVREAGIWDRVRFLGNVDNVNEWLSAMDVLLMPSLFEGLPFVLVEAQAGGLPCVVSSAVSKEADLTGLVRFVDLSEAPAAWADRVLEARTQSRPDTARQLIDAGYSMEDTARAVGEILEKGLDTGRGGSNGDPR